MSAPDYDVDDIYYDDDDYNYYYQSNEDEFLEVYLESSVEKQKRNIEYFDYECITMEQAKDYFNSIIQSVCKEIKLLPSLSKLLLINAKWNENEIVKNFESNPDAFLHSMRIKPLNKLLANIADSNVTNINSLEELSYTKYLNNNLCNLSINLTNKLMCNICLQSSFINHHKALLCEHYYCDDCWKYYLQIHINNGDATNIECMSTDCNILVPEDFINLFFPNTPMKKKYEELSLRDCINSNMYMRPCVGPNCTTIIKGKESKAKRVTCYNCNSCYCFKCGCEYHAPSDCKTIKLWLTKCEDDSETAHYISAHTKDCPECSSCIEKNGGCNHMKCYSCKYEFCWMCLDSWKTHGSQFYECSKYKENPNIINESEKAREALKKYLFYYERWDNHMRSLRLEDQTLARIKEKINEKVMSNSGTWIDWQYLLDAAALLAKCRYTLQYTYPYAYYMEPGARKSLLEYQQAQLEAEIENLSWKIEHAESTDRGDLENQMDIVEKRRTTVLEDFFMQC